MPLPQQQDPPPRPQSAEETLCQPHIPAPKKRTTLPSQLNNRPPPPRTKIAAPGKIQPPPIGRSLIHQNEELALLKGSSLVPCFELHQSNLQLNIDGEIHIYLFHDGSSHHIETTLSTCSANRWTGF